MSLEARNKELFVTTPDDIASCDEEDIPKLVEIYHYLKEKLEVESKLCLKYSPDTIEVRNQNTKGKGKQQCDEKSPIDYIYIAEDFKCPITCETVDGLYQLNCQHSVSPKVFLSLEKQECPYCRTEIKKKRNESAFLTAYSKSLMTKFKVCMSSCILQNTNRYCCTID